MKRFAVALLLALLPSVALAQQTRSDFVASAIADRTRVAIWVACPESMAHFGSAVTCFTLGLHESVLHYYLDRQVMPSFPDVVPLTDWATGLETAERAFAPNARTRIYNMGAKLGNPFVLGVVPDAQHGSIAFVYML